MHRSELQPTTEALGELKAYLLAGGIDAFLENIRAVAVLLDADGVMMGWNPAFVLAREATPGTTNLQDLLPPITREEWMRCQELALRTGEPAPVRLELGGFSGGVSLEGVLLRQSPSRLLLLGETGPAAPHGGGDHKAMLAELEELKSDLHDARQALDVKQKELRAVLAQTDEVVHTDALTLLPNRRWIISDLQQRVTYSERYGAPLSISMIDLDNFKDVNDTYGHAVGDQVLRFIASQMRDSIRQPDGIGRYGGDEFLVILPNTNVTAAAEQAARLCQQIRTAPIAAGRNQVHLTLSMGLAQYKPGVDDWRKLLERADQALYRAKNNGRDQWAILDA
jgi:diguanylate cyclase (GGDEF)-like protein